MCEIRFYVCEHCGNIIGVIHDAGVPMMCCGQKMTKLEAYEKHIAILRKYFSDDYIVKYMRKHIVGYLAGIEGVNKIKAALLTNCNLEEVMQIMRQTLS